MKPVAVTALPKYKLQVEYADGVTGEVDLSYLVGKGVFVAWNDRAAFEAVAIGDQGEFQWSDNIDLCSDAIYLTDNSHSNCAIHSRASTPGKTKRREELPRLCRLRRLPICGCPN